MNLKEVLGDILTAGKLKYCFECGICTSCCPMAELLGKNYNPRALLQKIILDTGNVVDSEEPWLCAWCYRCNKHCPQALRLPEIFLSMRRASAKSEDSQSFERALQRIVENVPLPLAATMVCFHPERAGLDREKALEKTEQLYRKHLEKEKGQRAQQAFEERIAIIGSGPAGLAAAYKLCMKGYGVTVFEALAEPGGMLRKCIPENRLPKKVIDKEVQILRDVGVEIKTAVTIGKDLNFGELKRDGFKAILVGAGAHKTQVLNIEGGDLKGVVHALDFLWEVNCGREANSGKKVVVIGGGNVAVDAARTAIRLEASEVTILYRRSREEMPAIPWEVKEAEEEGAKIELLVAPKRILGKDGTASGIECIRMQLGEPDDTGRRRPIPIEGSEFTRETDMVILATGETPELGFLPKEIELNEDGTIWTDPITMETSMQGVFAGGDAVTGPATVIEAIRAGICAAESIDNYIKTLRG